MWKSAGATTAGACKRLALRGARSSSCSLSTSSTRSTEVCAASSYRVGSTETRKFCYSTSTGISPCSSTSSSACSSISSSISSVCSSRSVRSKTTVGGSSFCGCCNTGRQDCGISCGGSKSSRFMNCSSSSVRNLWLRTCRSSWMRSSSNSSSSKGSFTRTKRNSSTHALLRSSSCDHRSSSSGKSSSKNSNGSNSSSSCARRLPNNEVTRSAATKGGVFFPRRALPLSFQNICDSRAAPGAASASSVSSLFLSFPAYRCCCCCAAASSSAATFESPSAPLRPTVSANRFVCASAAAADETWSNSHRLSSLHTSSRFSPASPRAAFCPGASPSSSSPFLCVSITAAAAPARPQLLLRSDCCCCCLDRGRVLRSPRERLQQLREERGIRAAAEEVPTREKLLHQQQQHHNRRRGSSTLPKKFFSETVSAASITASPAPAAAVAPAPAAASSTAPASTAAAAAVAAILPFPMVPAGVCVSKFFFSSASSPSSCRSSSIASRGEGCRSNTAISTAAATAARGGAARAGLATPVAEAVAGAGAATPAGARASPTAATAEATTRAGEAGTSAGTAVTATGATATPARTTATSAGAAATSAGAAATVTGAAATATAAATLEGAAATPAGAAGTPAEAAARPAGKAARASGTAAKATLSPTASVKERLLYPSVAARCSNMTRHFCPHVALPRGPAACVARNVAAASLAPSCTASPPVQARSLAAALRLPVAWVAVSASPWRFAAGHAAPAKWTGAPAAAAARPPLPVAAPVAAPAVAVLDPATAAAPPAVAPPLTAAAAAPSLPYRTAPLFPSVSRRSSLAPAAADAVAAASSRCRAGAAAPAGRRVAAASYPAAAFAPASFFAAGTAAPPSRSAAVAAFSFPSASAAVAPAAAVRLAAAAASPSFAASLTTRAGGAAAAAPAASSSSSPSSSSSLLSPEKELPACVAAPPGYCRLTDAGARETLVYLPYWARIYASSSPSSSPPSSSSAAPAAAASPAVKQARLYLRVLPLAPLCAAAAAAHLLPLWGCSVLARDLLGWSIYYAAALQASWWGMHAGMQISRLGYSQQQRRYQGFHNVLRFGFVVYGISTLIACAVAQQVEAAESIYMLDLALAVLLVGDWLCRLESLIPLWFWRERLLGAAVYVGATLALLLSEQVAVRSKQTRLDF